jgi:hypothetical protein
MRFGLSRSFWLMLAAVLAVTAGAIVVPRVYSVALLGSGYMTQILCTGMFVSGRSEDEVIAEDLSGPGLGLLVFFQPTVDHKAKTVTASAYGIGRQTAIYREGLGCTRLDGDDEQSLRAQAAGLFPALDPPPSDAEWPVGERVTTSPLPENVDGAASARRSMPSSPSQTRRIPATPARWSWCMAGGSWRSAMPLASTRTRP